LLGFLAITGCGAPCEVALGVYPPDHIVVTGAEVVEVLHISWTCDDFHSDTIDPPPSVTPDEQGEVMIVVALEAGSTVEVSFGNSPVVVNPAPVEGDNSWSFEVAESSEPLVVRICSEDQACAMYWANLYSGTG
jgi:hypothetical protein